MQIDPFQMLWDAFLPILNTFSLGLVTDLSTLMIGIMIILCILIAFDLLFDALTGSQRTLSGYKEAKRLRDMRSLDPLPEKRGLSSSEVELGANSQAINDAYTKHTWIS